MTDTDLIACLENGYLLPEIFGRGVWWKGCFKSNVAGIFRGSLRKSQSSRYGEKKWQQKRLHNDNGKQWKRLELES